MRSVELTRHSTQVFESKYLHLLELRGVQCSYLLVLAVDDDQVSSSVQTELTAALPAPLLSGDVVTAAAYLPPAVPAASIH